MKASLIIDYYLNNKIFDINDSSVNRDNYAYSIWLLKQKFQLSSVDFSTCDINEPSESDFILYFDLPKKDSGTESKLSYLFLFESEVISPLNWNKSKHNFFNKIFTWNDHLVDNKKYFKINFSHKFPDDRLIYSSQLIPFSDKKLCTLIAGNKKVSHPLELYSEREKTIRWFEKNAQSDFEFYGVGWNKATSSNRYVRYGLSKLPALASILAPKYCSYKGKVESKLEVMSYYKFAICYENAQMIPGYITEKIFDCFFAGCVPIYWGAPNITEHIPSNCFIDRRKFKSHQDLYDFIKNMSVAEYNVIQKNIENYIFSTKADPYRAETFAHTIVSHILNE